MKTYAEHHIIERNKFKWGSFGKFGDKPVKYTLLRDISDSHLMRIIEHLKYRPLCEDTLKLMQQEVTFRVKNYIFVPESYD